MIKCLKGRTMFSKLQGGRGVFMFEGVRGKTLSVSWIVTVNSELGHSNKLAKVIYHLQRMSKKMTMMMMAIANIY